MKSSHPNERNETRRPSDSTDYQGTAGEPIGFTNEGQPVVAGPGDGQHTRLDHVRDEGPRERIIPFTSARTTFYAEQADDEDKYDRLWTLHHHWDDDSTARRTYQDKIHVAKSLATAFDLSKNQKNRVVGIVTNVNGRRFNQNGGITGLALGAIAFVGEQDAESLEDRMLCCDKFNELCAQHGVDGWAACKKIKEVYRELTR